MGYMRHHAIVVTSYDKYIEEAHAAVLKIENESECWVSPISPKVVNGVRSFFIAPDGSKEGWTESDKGDAFRSKVISALGARSDEVGVKNGMTERVIDEEGHPRNGEKGWCNACHGRGKVKQDDTMYPFSVENVEEFATFLESSGGFEIH